MRSRIGRNWIERLGKGLALTGALGLVAMAASLSVTTALAWSASDYSLTTQTFTTTGVPSPSGNLGSASDQASTGQYIYDTANVAIAHEFNFVQGGDVVFSLYQGTPNPSCQGLGTPLQSATVPLKSTEPGTTSETVSSLSSPTYGYFQIPSNGAGSSYFWVATYNDGQEPISIRTGCLTEEVSVEASVPQLGVTTQASPSSLVLGGSVSDSASVSNWQTLRQEDSAASGTVTFALFQGTACSGSPVYRSSAIQISSSGSASTSANAFTPRAAGPYEWQATVSVDTGHGWPQISPFSSACSSEPLAVEATTRLSTAPVADPRSIAGLTQFGAQLSDQATVSGGWEATGTVTFKLFDSASCSGAPVYTDSAPLSSGSAQSGEYVANQAGVWQWEAQYSGDAYNTSSSSACGSETLSVLKASPQVTTVTSNGTAEVPVGSEISDSTSVSNAGAPSAASGEVTFNLFDPSQTSCWGSPVFINRQALTVGSLASTATSAAFLVSHLGTYQWTVSYGGDANNNPATSSCGAEQVDVVQATPSITTSTPSSIVVGQKVRDEAEITGGFEATSNATVTFGLYANDSCTDLVGQTSTEAVNGAGDAYSEPVLVSAAGTYYWEDTYSGNQFNQTVTSPCQSEPVQVTKHCSQITTQQQTPVTTAPVETVSDTATITGLYPVAQGQSLGAVHFELFGPETVTAPQCACQGNDLVIQGWAPVVLVNGQYQASFSGQVEHPLLPGDYYWEADYSGDANNLPASSGCGELTVVQANTPKVSTTASSGGSIGTVLTDTAVVTPVVSPTPATGAASQPTSVANGAPDSVHFQLFLNDPSCAPSGMVADLGSFTESETTNPDGTLTYTVSLPASGYKTVKSGTYYWNVIFTGDAYNNQVSSCGEPVSITSPTGAVLAVSTPNTGSDLFGPGLLGSLALFLGGLLLMAGRRVLRPRTR